MFISYESRFPEIPIDFSSHEAYKKTWLYLIQYEIYSKLLSRSSNKKHKIEIKNEELEDLKLDEGEELAKKQEVKVSAQRIWVSYCISVELKNQKILEEKKEEQVGEGTDCFYFRMYKKAPLDDSVEDSDDYNEAIDYSSEKIFSKSLQKKIPDAL